MKTFYILRIIIEIICFLYVIASVSGNLDADSVYEFLSRRLDGLLHETGKLKSQMEEMNERMSILEEKLAGFETTTVTSNYPGAISEVAATGLEEKLTIKSTAMHKMLADEKANIRESIQNFDAMFTMFRSELKEDMFSFKRKMIDGFALMNFSLDELTSIVEIKDEQLRSDIEQLKDETDNVTNKQNMTQQSVGSLEANLKALTSTVSSLSSSLSSQTSYLSSQISSVSSSLQSKISSESSSLSSRISTLSSSLYSKMSSESSSLSSSISSLSSRISNEEDRKVAFSARLLKMDSYYLPKEKIKFDDVRYNYGSGYDPSSGIFTAPKSGTYLFAGTVEATNSGIGHADIMVRGYFKVDLLAAKGFSNTGTAVIVDYLSAGDKAWIQGSDIAVPKHYINHYRSHFSGVLID